MTTRLNWLLISIGLGLMIVVGLLNSAEIARADTESSHPAPFVALIGDGPTVNSTAASFISDGVLKFVREYPDVGDYLFESPIAAPPAGDSHVIRMFQVTTYSIHVQDVLSSVVSATLPLNNVIAETGDLRWLSYVPGQVVIHGPLQRRNQHIQQFRQRFEHHSGFEFRQS